jgi:hypothetical protein
MTPTATKEDTMSNTMPTFGVKVPYNDDHHEQTQRTNAYRDGYEPCVVCGRAVNQTKPHWMVRVHYGGDRVVTDAMADRLNEIGFANAELGGHPIGPDCLKQHPEIKPYAVRIRHVDDIYQEPDGLLAVPGFGTSQY